MTLLSSRRLISILALGLAMLLDHAVRPPMAYGQDEVFVANFSANSITVYPRTATGDTAPTRTLTGAATGLNGPIGLVVDMANGELVVTNSGNNSVTVYPRTASGNTAPTRQLIGPATGLDQPFGVAVDVAHGELFVANAASITVYSRTASGNSAPIRTLAGAATGLNGPAGIVADAANNELLVANEGNDSITVDNRTARGNTAPTRTLSGAATGLNTPFAVVVDPVHDELVVANFDSVTAFGRTASGDTAPTRTLAGATTGLAGGDGLIVDTWNDELLVANFNANSITAYGRTSSGDTAPGRTLVGATTGLSGPSFIALATTPLTFTVINTSGSAAVAGSLPWAVQQANLHLGLDFIDFNIPGSGVQVITLSNPLLLNDQVVVDGKTQPGYAGSPVVYVVGDATAAGSFVLQGDSSGSTIQGLGLHGYTSNAVTILSSSVGIWIQDNYLGFFTDGVSPVVLNSSLHPGTRGLVLLSSFNTIRGNTISGVDNAIVIGENPFLGWSGTFYKTNSIQNNRIGTNPAGDSAAGFGNTGDGIFVGAGGRENFLGPDNVLSGNASSGVELFDPTVIGNVVFRNAIGVNAARTAAIPNNQLGVLLTNGANGNAVGGPFGGNVISANTHAGVALGAFLPRPFTDAAIGNWVQNNIIGLDIGQTGAPGSQSVGISLSNGSTLNDIEGNVIAGHTNHGAQLLGVVTNSVSNNWIGMSSSGVARPNGGFGVYFHDASNNFATGNAFGPNTLGPIGADGTSCCNVTN
jgi:hypothetical protein